MRRRSHLLTRATQYKCSGYTSGPDYSSNSCAYLWGRLGVFFDVCLLQVGSVAPRDRTPQPVASSSTRSDHLFPFNTAVISPAPTSSSRAPTPVSISMSAPAPAPALALASTPVPALDSPPAAVPQDDSQNVPVTRNTTLSLLVTARPSTRLYSRTSKANTATVTPESSANPSASTLGDQNNAQDTQNAASTPGTSNATPKEALMKKPTKASAKKTAKGAEKKITARRVAVTIFPFMLQPPVCRSLCLADWKKDNPSLPENKFENHWRKKVTSDKKKVRRTPLLILSHLTSDALIRSMNTVPSKSYVIIVFTTC